MPALLVTALVVGLAGGVHCMAMCGGIVAALSLRGDPASSALVRLARQLAYGLGRVTSYAAAGAIAGAAGGLALHFQHLLPMQIVLLVVANALVVALGLTLAGFRAWMRPLERVGLVVWGALRRVGVRLAPARTTAGAFAVGLAWGWIPCGLVYGVLATALVSGGAARGAAVMAAFGVGTLPNLLAAGLVAERLKSVLVRPRARLVAGAVVVLLGLAGFARIPFIEEHLRQGLHMHHGR